MNKWTWLGLAVGSTLGGMLPNLWNADLLSLSGVLCSTLGGAVGVWAGWRIGRSM